jgi:hypothetical protein
MDMLNSQWPKEWSSGDLVAAVQTGNRLTLWPDRAPLELEALRTGIDRSLQQLPAMNIADSIRTRAGILLSSAKDLLRP